MKKFFTTRLFLLIFILGFGNNVCWTQSIFTNPITGTNPYISNPYTAGQIVDINITVSGIGRGTGITGDPGADRYNAKGWVNPTLDIDDYFEFTLTPNSGAKINFLNFTYKGTASGSGPATFAFRSSLNGYTTNIGTPSATGTTIDLSTADYQEITSPITFRFYGWGASSSVGTFSIDEFTFNGVVEPITPQFYQSVPTGGDWNNTSTWQSSTDGITWNAATLIPTSLERAITVQPGTVTVSTSVSLDETTINGTLQIATGGVLNINDGTGNDIDIQNNGLLQILSTNSYATTIFPGSAAINVATGGKIEIGDGVINVGADYETFATSSSNIWNDGSVFEWNTPASLTFNNTTFFPNAGASVVPKFLVTKVTGPLGGGSATTVNGLFVSNFDLSFNGNGTKNFRNGISGNCTLTFPDITNTYNITSANSEISGNLTLILFKDIRFNAGTTVTSGSTVVVSNTSSNGFNKQAGDFIIDADAKLDMGTMGTITNSSPGSVIINGTFATGNADGFSGTNSSIPSGTVTLNPGCTIEYNALGDQTVTSRSDYKNITFSGSGIKTPSSGFTPTGTLTITGSAILDATGYNIGDGVAGTTNFTMDGGRLILSTTGTQPMMNGVYNLSGGVIQFDNNGATTQAIRSPETYYAIEVTGSNVGNSLGNINLAPNGSFTVYGTFNINADQIIGTFGSQTIIVEPGATFQCGNANGFSGGNGSVGNITSVKSDIETIDLLPGSTVDYIRSNNQTITNQIPYQNLTISGTGNKTAPSGILEIKGNLIKSGTSVFAHNNGTVLLDSTGAQTFAGLTYNNLILTSNTKSTTGNSTVIDSIKINDGTTLSVSNGDTITLHSDALKTAHIGQLGTGAIQYNTTGKFLVERYIPAKKAWRFLSVPVNSTQTIKEAWQENATVITDDPKPGYGTQITDNNSGTWSANGFDAFSQNGPSVKYYNPATDSYTGIASTLDFFDPNRNGYMTFIRGDRSATGFSSPASSTVLRMTGKLFTGDQPDINLVSGQIIPVNNPYASAIDLRNISKSDDIFYYVWDPNFAAGYGFGGFQTLSWNGTDYEIVPGNTGSYGTTNNYIESGQAFFASTLGNDTSLKVTENAKCISSPLIVPFIPQGITGQKLKTTLYSVSADGTAITADGVLINFSDSYTNEVNGEDAKKAFNTGANLSIKKPGVLLAIERKHSIIQNDTIFLNITGMRIQQYQLQFNIENLNADIKVFLEDNYLHTSTALDLNGNTTVDFNIVNIPSSYAADRFRIVLIPPVVLPLSLTDLKAYRKNKDVVLEWTVENESNVKQYEVEKSVDSNHFLKVYTVAAVNKSLSNYNWLDINTVNGYNYYRIKSTDLNGKSIFSSIVKVYIGKTNPGIFVYPNPVSNGIIGLQFINMPSGTYKIKLVGKRGRVMLTDQINHAEGTSIEKLYLNKFIANGIYQLEINKPDGSVNGINVSVLK
jgi:hypothetical protein